MNKQIEEMAQEMAGCERESCETCSVFLETLCVPLYSACRAYGAGYRKQSEGVWVVDVWDNEKEEWVPIPYNKHLHEDVFCSLCKEHALLDGKEYGVASNYCPNCGAHMRGDEQ